MKRPRFNSVGAVFFCSSWFNIILRVRLCCVLKWRLSSKAAHKEDTNELRICHLKATLFIFSYSYIAHGNPLSHCDTDFSDNHFIFQVDTAFRGQGLGGLLIEAAEDVSRRSLDAAWFGALTVQNAGNQSDTLLHFDCSVAVAWGMRWNCWSTSLSVLELNVPQTLPRLFCRSRRLFLVGWFLVFFIWYRVSFLFVVGKCWHSPLLELQVNGGSWSFLHLTLHSWIAHEPGSA